MFLWHICCFYYETLALTPSVLVASCGMVLGRGRFLVTSVGRGESPHVVSNQYLLGGARGCQVEMEVLALHLAFSEMTFCGVEGLVPPCQAGSQDSSLSLCWRG